MNSPLDSLSETSFEFTMSRTQALTVSWQGRLLCSSRDPLAEAKGWVRSQFFKDSTKVIVLGLGAGHHITALAEERLNQRIVVLDYHQTLIEKFLVPKNVEVINALSLGEEAMKSLVQEALPVLGFRPAWSGLERDYEYLKRDLCGQTPASLRAQAEFRGYYNLSQALNEKAPTIVTVKEINSLMEKDKDSKESKVWQVLRELVK